MDQTFVGFLLGVAMPIFLCASVWFALHRARQRATYAPLTEPSLRLPGHTLRKDLSERRDEVYFIYLISAMAASAMMSSIIFSAPTTVKVAIFIVILGYGVWAWKRMEKLFPICRNLILGLECEEYVGQELNLLMRHGAYVFHDVPYRYGNIDHVVVGHGQVLAIETKGRRKPGKVTNKDSREATVKLEGESLFFPNYKDTTSVPQAKRHAEHLSETIKDRCNLDFEVIPVIAVPGWGISFPDYKSGNVLLVSPKGDNALKNWLGNKKNETNSRKVADLIEDVVRSVPQSSTLTDPDAHKHWDFWLNRKPIEKKLN